MTTSSKRLVQKAIAIIVIVAILDVIGISLALIVFMFMAGVIVWRVIQRSERRETREVFDFYVSTDEILRDEERHWYGFEIAEVISRGEQVFHWMPDPPPLVSFALGALHHRAGDYGAAVEELAAIVENGLTEERHRSSPSPQLRRYVAMLRHIEREPSVAPLALGAVRSLERMRRSRATALLGESRQRLEKSCAMTELSDVHHALNNESSNSGPEADRSKAGTLNSQMPPRSISEVLQDVYQDEKTI